MHVSDYNTSSVPVEKYFLQRFSFIIQYNTKDADVDLGCACKHSRALCRTREGTRAADYDHIGLVFYQGRSNLVPGTKDRGATE
jgi:hypothetical protein